MPVHTDVNAHMTRFVLSMLVRPARKALIKEIDHYLVRRTGMYHDKADLLRCT